MEISKEFVSIILNEEVSSSRIEGDYVFLIRKNTDYGLAEGELINLYEFIYKNCIHWAFNHGYNLAVLEDIKTEKFGVLTDSFLVGFNFSEDVEKQKTREEAIIKACEWILEQSKCQN